MIYIYIYIYTLMIIKVLAAGLLPRVRELNSIDLAIRDFKDTFVTFLRIILRFFEKCMV